MGERTPAHDRFFGKVTEDPDTGCWLFAGRSSRQGYVQFRPGGLAAKVYAHRWSYEYLIGPVPDGLFLDHLCRVTNCVNPAHLEPVTHVENCLRATRLITECERGHRFTPETTYVDARGWRSCHPCRLEASRRWREKHIQSPPPTTRRSPCT